MALSLLCLGKVCIIWCIDRCDVSISILYFLNLCCYLTTFDFISTTKSVTVVHAVFWLRNAVVFVAELYVCCSEYVTSLRMKHRVENHRKWTFIRYIRLHQKSSYNYIRAGGIYVQLSIDNLVWHVIPYLSTTTTGPTSSQHICNLISQSNICLIKYR